MTCFFPLISAFSQILLVIFKVIRSGHMRNTGQRLLPPSPQSLLLGCTSRVPSPDLSREHDLDNHHPRLLYLKKKRQQGLARWTKKTLWTTQTFEPCCTTRQKPWSMSITRRGTLQLTILIIWAIKLRCGRDRFGRINRLP